MGEQRGGKNEIDGFISDGQGVTPIVFSGDVVDLASVAGSKEFEALAIKVAAAPIQHLLVNINSYIAAGEGFVFKPVVAEMMRKPATTATYIQNMGVQAAKAGEKCVEPKIFCVTQIINMIGKDTIGCADSDSQMIGRNVGEFLENMAGNKINDIEQTFDDGVIGETGG